MVLCGGQSIRMGQDKGLLNYASGTWVEAAVEKLKVLSLPVLVSVNEAQYKSYSNLFQNSMLVIDNNTLTVHGPLKGILSAHLQYPNEDLLILACDMRNMQPAVLEYLINTFSCGGVDAAVFRNGDQMEPLCGIYSASGLHKIYEHYLHGLLKKFSMHSVLQLLHTTYLPVPEKWKGAFNNFNTAEDLQML